MPLGRAAALRAGKGPSSVMSDSREVRAERTIVATVPHKPGEDKTMATRALIPGGGGPVGIAWETGLAAGLAQEGVRVGEADLIVGTSAGSVVGAQLALGREPEKMLAAQRAQFPVPGQSDGAPPPAPDLGALMQIMAKAATV